MCGTVFGNKFGALKHLTLPYVQGHHLIRIRRGSTTLNSLTIECCTEYHSVIFSFSRSKFDSE